MLEAIEGAAKHIHLETYIFRSDETGARFLRALAERARAGVEVRLLFDGFGSRGLDHSALAELRRTGGDAVAFNPLGRLYPRWAPRRRDHRKILVVDGEVAFTGGLNIGDEYFYGAGFHGDPLTPWRDAHLRVSGPAVRMLEAVFLESWFRADGPDRPWAELTQPLPSTSGGEAVAVLADGPTYHRRRMRDLLVAALERARQHARLVTPYFLPGPQNDACLSCHQGGKRMNWAGSAHDQQNVACASCHTAHAVQDPVLMKNIDPMVFTRQGQASVCFQCHKETRAQVQNRVSSHPLREGKIDCSDCHNTHGTIATANLRRPTLNETCYQCHAEKRGPFLWEHAPVREDCANCHTPHGSNHPALLKGRVPQLCQQCHLAVFHPSAAYTGPNAAAGDLDFHVVEKGCLNCHSEVHGSNHPSGVRWNR